MFYFFKRWQSQNQMINILYILCRGDLGGGGENYLIILLRHLDRTKFRPVVIVPKDGALSPVLQELGAAVYTVPVVTDKWLANDNNWYSFLKEFPERVRTILDIIRNEKINLVHTNTNFVFDGAVAAKIAKIPHVWHAHIEFDPTLPLFKRFPLDSASYAGLIDELSDAVIAVSHGVKAHLVPHCAETKIKVIHNGLDLQEVDKAVHRAGRGVRHELELSGDTSLICTVGRICKDKSFNYYIESAAKVLQKKPDVHFIHVGPGDDKAETAMLEGLITRLGIRASFHFLGYRGDVPQIIAESDVFVQTSTKEGLPYVILEAMSCRKPVVAMKCVGPGEMIVDGETGFLAEVGDVTAVSESIIKILEDHALMTEMGVKGRERVENLFNSKKHAEKIEALYTEVCTGTKPNIHSYPAELFVNLIGELGSMGESVSEHAHRINQLEYFVNKFQNNIIYRGVRSLYKTFGQMLSKKTA
jgi:glycosyltransferase involved in cell wall biosynthesis